MCKILPTNFEFWIGGYFCKDQKISFDDGSMVYEMRYPSNHEVPEERIEIQPDPKEWLQFWETLECIGIWTWKREYVNAGICDGTQWKLNIEKDNKKISIYGSNEYPDSFQNFTTALNALFSGKIKL